MRKGSFLLSFGGNQALTSERCGQLLKLLSEEPLNWKRPGSVHPSKISLALKFVPFNSDDLVSSTPLKKPIVHIYWLSALDVDGYKANEREPLVSWFAALREANIQDWFIVYDTSVPGPTKQRQLVFERLKSDFNKHTDRLIELDVSGGKWTSLLIPLREKILQTISDVVIALQNRIHTEKEKYTTDGWHFFNFAALQFDIANLFSGMELHDEVLAQLDEMDALLCLLISNAVAFGTVSGGDGFPPWLKQISAQPSLSAPCFLWYYEIRGEPFRQQLVARQASYLDLRTYLFCCQVSTLFAQYRRKQQGGKLSKGEDMSLEEEFCLLLLHCGNKFMTTVLQEWVHLKINLTDTRRDAWTVLMVLEIIALARKLVSVPNSPQYLCNLHGMLVSKVKQLGKITGLYPAEGVDAETSQVELEDVLLWIPKYKEMAETDPESSDSPVSALRTLLSGKGTFAQAFVKFHESAVAVMKHFKRFRQSVALSVQLADYNSIIGRDNLTVDQWLTCLLNWQKQADLYETERWERLYFGLLMRVVNHFDPTSKNFIKFTAALGTTQSVSADIRLSHFNKLLAAIDSSTEAVRLDQSIFCHPFSVEFVDKSWTVRHMSTLQCFLTLRSEFPSPMTFTGVTMNFGQRDLTGDSNKVTVVCTNEEVFFQLLPGCSQTVLVKSEPITVLGRLKLIEVEVSVGNCTFVIPLASASHQALTLEIEEEKAEITLKVLDDELLYSGVPGKLVLTLSCGTEQFDTTTQLIVGSSDNRIEFLDSCKDTVTIGVSPIKDGTTFTTTLACLLPIEMDADATIEKQVVVTWRERIQIFPLMFKQPFQLQSCLRIVGTKHWIFLTVYNSVSPKNLLLHSLSQKVTSAPDVQLSFVSAGLFQQPQEIRAGAQAVYAWNVQHLESLTDDLICSLTISFSVNNSGLHKYEKQVIYAGSKKRLEVTCAIENSSSTVCRVDNLCRLVVSVQMMAAYYDSGDVMLEITYDESWCIHDKLALLSFDSKGSAKFETSVVPKCVGYVPLPGAKLWLLNSNNAGTSRTKTEIPPDYVIQPSRGRQVHVLQTLKQPTVSVKPPPIMLDL